MLTLLYVVSLVLRLLWLKATIHDVRESLRITGHASDSFVRYTDACISTQLINCTIVIYYLKCNRNSPVLMMTLSFIGSRCVKRLSAPLKRTKKNTFYTMLRDHHLTTESDKRETPLLFCVLDTPAFSRVSAIFVLFHLQSDIFIKIYSSFFIASPVMFLI